MVMGSLRFVVKIKLKRLLFEVQHFCLNVPIVALKINQSENPFLRFSSIYIEFL